MKQFHRFFPTSKPLRGFLLIITLLLYCTNSWGVDVTFSAAYESQGKSGTGSNATATIDNVTISSTKAYGASATEVREYAGSKLTVTAPGSITKVVITFTNSDYATAFGKSVNTGSASTSGAVTTWTGTSNNVTFTAAKQGRWSKIVVTYKSSCNKPTLTFNNGQCEVYKTLELQSLKQSSNSNGAISYAFKTDVPDTEAAIHKSSTDDNTWYFYPYVTDKSYTIVATQAADADFCETTAEFTVNVPDKVYTLTWFVNGEEYSTTEGTIPNAPTTDCNGKVFVGWTDQANITDGQKPATLFTTTLPTLTEDKTFYAVFATKTNEESLTKMTTIPVAGDVVYLVYEKGDTKCELNGINSNVGTTTKYTNLPAGLFPLVVEAGSITGTIAFLGTGGYLSYGKGTAGSGNSLYLYNTTTPDNYCSWVVTVTGDYFKISNQATATRYLQFNSSSPRFCCYTGSQQNVQFYKVGSPYTDYTTTCTEEPCTPIDAPSNLQSTDITSTGVTLSWNSVEHAAQYEILVTDGDNDYTYQTTSSTYIVTDLTPNTYYLWGVKAKGESGYCDSDDHDKTAEFTTTEKVCQQLPAPTNLQVVRNSDWTYTFSWDAVDHAVEYTMSGTFSGTIKGTTSTRAITVIPGNTYTVYVKAKGDGSDYCDSEQASYTFTADSYFTVTLDAGTGTCSQTTLQGGIVTLPDALSTCDGWTFMGWSTTSVAETTIAPTLIPSASYTANADITLYAVYQQTSEDETGTPAETITLTATDFDLTTSYSPKSATVNGYTFSINKGLKSTDSEAKDAIQMNKGKGDGILYNTSAIHNLKTIQLNVAKGNNTTTIYQGTSEKPTVDEAGTATTTSTISITPGNEYFCIKVSGATYFSSIVITYGGHTSLITYASNPQCTPCGEANYEFELGNKVVKSPKMEKFTNRLLSDNTKAVTYSSNKTEIATVNATTGEVTLIGAIGEAVITATQPRDNDICPVEASYTLIVQEPQVEVVEVTTNSIIIEHDFEGETEVLMQERVTTIEGTVADDIFFSKYFEAASNMKLLALYNGTDHPIDFSKLRIRVASDENWPTKVGEQTYIQLDNISALVAKYPSKMLPQLTEIILWSNNKATPGTNPALNNTTLHECLKMTIDNKPYTYDDMEAGRITNWYCIGDHTTYNVVDADGHNQITLNGDDAVLLERLEDDGTWTAIDLIGAGTQEAPNQTAVTTISSLHMDPPGGWANTTVQLSTNRCLLYRKKGTKSGYDAVKLNIEDFVTLGTEWEGSTVNDGNGNNAFCNSGEMFAELAEFDYAHYFTEYVDLTEDKAGVSKNDDGTFTVKIDDLQERACDYLKINIIDKQTKDIISETGYKVPIIVDGHKTTGDAIFYNEGSTACTTCDVVILDGASLTKNADNTENDIRAVRNLEVYAGGTLNLPAETNYQVRSLAFRSKEDKVSSATLDGNLTNLTGETYHDKRITNARWYWITLPQDCRISTVTFRNGDPAVYGTDWILRTYDGEQRAQTQNGGCWKNFSGDVMQAGVGYIVAVTPKAGHTYRELRFPMSNYQTEHTDKAVLVDDYGAGMDITPNHKGWNLVGNPYVSYYSSNAWSGLTLGKLIENSDNEYELTNLTIPYVTIPQNAGYSEYIQAEIGNYSLPPFMSYFVQVGGEQAEQDALYVNFTAQSRKTANKVVARQADATDTDAPIRVGINLSNDKGETDYTSLVISDRYTNAYEIGADLLKWRGTYYTRYTKPVLASAGADGELAFNALSDDAARQGVQLHYFAAQQGQYTFSLSRQYDLTALKEVILYDTQSGTSVNLLQEDYRFSSDKTDDKNRFLLYVSVERTPSVITSIGNLGIGIYAISENHNLRILNLPADAHIRIYDTLGRIIADEQAHAAERNYTVPCAGVYNISVTTTTNQNQTLRAIVK